MQACSSWLLDPSGGRKRAARFVRVCQQSPEPNQAVGADKSVRATRKTWGELRGRAAFQGGVRTCRWTGLYRLLKNSSYQGIASAIPQVFRKIPFQGLNDAAERFP